MAQPDFIEALPGASLAPEPLLLLGQAQGRQVQNHVVCKAPSVARMGEPRSDVYVHV